MPQPAMSQWEQAFRAAAKVDQHAILRDHLKQLGLPDSPKLLLEGTIQAMRALSLWYTLDRHGPNSEQTVDDELLELQRYNPVDATDARYAFTFDLYGKAFARILVESKVGTLDLADLYTHNWSKYKVVGYSGFWVTRTDWSKLKRKELQKIEEEVTNDLRYDFPEDELDISFDTSLDRTFLYVTVQEVYDMEDDTED
jgi:hypothetical protein